MTLRKPAGLTLIELMVAMAILAIISAVAYPLYETQSRKANRPLATTALEKIAQTEQRFFTDNGTFTTDLTQLQGLSTNDYSNSRYKIEAAVDGNTFVISATAIGPQENDKECTVFTLDNVGRRGALKSDGSGGSIPATENCWGKTR